VEAEVRKWKLENRKWGMPLAFAKVCGPGMMGFSE
jgi:hypothetical protein